MVAVAAAVAALLLAPSVWAVDTLGHATSGTFPEGGPANVQTADGGGMFGGFGGRRASAARPGTAAGPPAPAALARWPARCPARRRFRRAGRALGTALAGGAALRAAGAQAAGARRRRHRRAAGRRRRLRSAAARAGFGGGGMGAPFGRDGTTTQVLAYVKSTRRRHDRRVQPVQRGVGDHRQRREGRRASAASPGARAT